MFGDTVLESGLYRKMARSLGMEERVEVRECTAMEGRWTRKVRSVNAVRFSFLVFHSSIRNLTKLQCRTLKWQTVD